MATTKRFDVKDLALSAEGVRRIEWADRQMPVLGGDPRALRARAAAVRATASPRACTSPPRRRT